jgi:hypothetical protein
MKNDFRMQLVDDVFPQLVKNNEKSIHDMWKVYC